jgi:acetyltransferase
MTIPEPVTMALRDGRPIIVRAVLPADRSCLQRGVQALSARSRRDRFLMGRVALSDAELDYLTDVDHRDHVALLAVTPVPDGACDGVGVARWARLRNAPASAEIAITIVDHHQRRGAGTLLLVRLAELAIERGVERFCATFHAGNPGIVALMRRFAAQVEHDGPGLLRAELGTADVVQISGRGAVA